MDFEPCYIAPLSGLDGPPNVLYIYAMQQMVMSYFLPDGHSVDLSTATHSFCLCGETKAMQAIVAERRRRRKNEVADNESKERGWFSCLSYRFYLL